MVNQSEAGPAVGEESSISPPPPPSPIPKRSSRVKRKAVSYPGGAAAAVVLVGKKAPVILPRAPVGRQAQLLALAKSAREAEAGGREPAAPWSGF